jgi:hypothetical protein
MLSSNDCIIKRISGIALLVLLINTYPAISQVSILDSAFTFQAGMVKTGNALNIISRRTGYYFTYDSKLIDTERKTTMSFSNTRLQIILDSVLQNDSLKYSVINKYIIIYKISSAPAETTDIKPEWEVKYITGIITDFESGDPMPFATIGLISSGRGTVSNNNGEFGLKIPGESINDSLSVSYLGYYNRKVPVKQAIDNYFNIRMMREYIPIPEIIIKNQVPQEIIRKAYSSIARNYGNSPVNMRAFYREAVLKKSTLQIYSEAIIDIFKSAYSGSIFSDQMKIIRSRKVENLGLKDTLTLRLKAGLSTCLLLDGARNSFDFMLPENYSQYDYRMTDIVTVDDESAYVIDFVQKPMVNIPLFKGSIYINTNSYAIIQAEFEINPQYINEVREEFINTAAKGYKMWPTSIKYYVSYRRMEERYFLNHVRGELNFTAKQNKRLFNSTFGVFFELAVTDIKIENVTRFDRDELAPTHSIFSKTISDYDPEFWGDMDFLKPEENLLQALKNMKARMQEFSK